MNKFVELTDDETGKNLSINIQYIIEVRPRAVDVCEILVMGSWQSVGNSHWIQVRGNYFQVNSAIVEA